MLIGRLWKERIDVVHCMCSAPCHRLYTEMKDALAHSGPFFIGCNMIGRTVHGYNNALHWQNVTQTTNSISSAYCRRMLLPGFHVLIVNVGTHFGYQRKFIHLLDVVLLMNLFLYIAFMMWATWIHSLPFRPPLHKTRIALCWRTAEPILYGMALGLFSDQHFLSFVNAPFFIALRFSLNKLLSLTIRINIVYAMRIHTSTTSSI